MVHREIYWSHPGIRTMDSTGHSINWFHKLSKDLFRMLGRIKQLLKKSIVLIVVLEFSFSFGGYFKSFRWYPHNWNFFDFGCRKSYNEDIINFAVWFIRYDILVSDLPLTVSGLTKNDKLTLNYKTKKE